MSPKELSYIEDALGHETFLKTQCQEAIQNLQDAELKSCVEKISQQHKRSLTISTISFKEAAKWTTNALWRTFS